MPPRMEHGPPTGGDSLHLRVLATSDVHANLLPYDYFADRPAANIGLARLAPLIARLRAECDAAILLDNGDFLQGTPLADQAASDLLADKTGLHPSIAAMNAMRYDAATLGNHEFNYGLPLLRHAIAGAAFPVVSANVVAAPACCPLDDQRIVPASALLQVNFKSLSGAAETLRIGVIGFAPPQITVWDKHVLGGKVAMRDIVAAAVAHVPALRAGGADIVVALAHSGIGGADPLPGIENALVPLAAVPGIDAIVGGHTHRVFPGPDIAATDLIDPEAGTINGCPTVMPGPNGAHLGVIDLWLTRGPDGWKVARFKVRVLDPEPDPCAGTPHPVVMAAHQRTLTAIRQPIGRTLVPLQSYFSLVAGDRIMGLLAQAQTDFARASIRGTAHEGLPVLSVVSPFRAGGMGGVANFTDIAPGPLLLRDAAAIYLFPNRPSTLLLTGAGLRDWLEQSAGLFCHLNPSRQDQPLHHAEVASYSFDIIAGVEYVIDLAQPPRFDATGQVIDPANRRIARLTHQGRPVADTDRFVVQTNSYRAAGGGGFAAAASAPLLHGAQISLRDLIVAHIRGKADIAPAALRNWSFAPMPGTSATFTTAPRGRAFLADMTDRRLRALGPGDNGLWRFAIDL